MSRDEVACRRALPADALCLAALGLQVFLDTYAVDGLRPALAREALQDHLPEAVARRLASPDIAILIAERAGHVVGFAETTMRAPNARLPAATAAELNRLYVQERFTGRGVGAMLLAQSEAIAASSGATVLWLTAWAENPRALRFYARRGYAELGAGIFEFESDRYETRVFAKSLTPSATSRRA
ncbi:MAG: GNAT family N-acetyltransferase [Alphaproteobacteria bacterium]|nr:GNAT family N-acetyltransferase [Alphaproteobacteria bacterium]